jgi:hypothetical protein
MYIYVYKMWCVCVLDERQKLFDEVEEEWTERERQATSLISPGASSSPEEECEGDTSDESEECIVKVLFLCACAPVSSPPPPLIAWFYCIVYNEIFIKTSI